MMRARALTATEVLWLDERLADGATEPALVLLTPVLPPEEAERLSEWPLGKRDAALWALRCRSFGVAARARARCAACDTELELDVPNTVLGAVDAVEAVPPIVVNELRIVARLVTTGDVVALRAHVDLGEARAELISRCVVSATRGGTALSPTEIADLPEEVIAEIAARLDALDPDASSTLICECAECGARCELAFDVGSFMAEEVVTRAARTLDEIDALARTYGWTESEILALSSHRRRRYLARIGDS